MTKTAKKLSAKNADESLAAHMIELRRWFHQHPELSFEEATTAERIIAELISLGIAFDYSGVGHAVIASIDGQDNGRKAIALRAEMDALPGEESTGASYTSVNSGKVHACGHGAHMAMLLGAAHLLVETPPPGPVRLIFQPAEERGAGSRVAIKDGALRNVAAIFAGHVTHDYETGNIMVRDGTVTAQSDRFGINVHGRGGHGARPHEAIDAIVISGFLITALQTIVSREINPLHPSVVTIGKVRAGSAANVIAEKAELYGSIRTSRASVREHVHNGIRRMASAAAELHNAAIDVEIDEGYPPVINEPVSTDVARAAAATVVGPKRVVTSEYQSMGSEDFSYYLHDVPGCFVRFGARHPDWEPTPLHSPSFDIDENVLLIGARFFERVARSGSRRVAEFPDGI